jgi:hypothetical protein
VLLTTANARSLRAWSFSLPPQQCELIRANPSKCERIVISLGFWHFFAFHSQPAHPQRVIIDSRVLTYVWNFKSPPIFEPPCSSGATEYGTVLNVKERPPRRAFSTPAKTSRPSCREPTVAQNGLMVKQYLHNYLHHGAFSRLTVCQNVVLKATMETSTAKHWISFWERDDCHTAPA